MMEQYFEIKEKYKDYLLFYRIGDFYEMFYDDAKVASRELDLTLTGKDCGEKERAPMCGVPFHASEGYIGKLIEKGFKVAICEQTEDPATAKGLVRREVIRVVTPGTVLETNLLSETKNNYLCTVYVGEFASGIAFADVSTGQVFGTSLDGAEMLSDLKKENKLSYDVFDCNLLSERDNIQYFALESSRYCRFRVAENGRARHG